MRSTFRTSVLRVLWGAVHRRYKAEQPYVIAVTGSVGKTSTKEALATVLSEAGKLVVKTYGNLATDTGIPLSLLGFTEQVKSSSAWVRVLTRARTARFKKPAERPYWVLEYSSDKPGDLAYLGQHIPPDVLVYTSGGPVHLEYYKDQAGVQAELVDLLRFLKPEGYVVVNGDDQFLQEITWPEGTQRFGVAGLVKRTNKVDLRGTVSSFTGKGMVCEFAPDTASKDPLNKAQSLSAKVAVIGRQQLIPLVAAALVAEREGVQATAIKKGLEAYAIPPGRGRLIAGVKGSTIVDDSANASPEAAVAGVAMLRPWAQGKRTVAVLGTMNELGDAAEEAHMEVAQAAAKAVDFLVTVGSFADRMAEAARKAGMPGHHILAFAKPEQLMSQIEQVVERGDIIYVKASQNGMRLERLVKQLMAKPQEASKLLVRQSNAWKD